MRQDSSRIPLTVYDPAQNYDATPVAGVNAAGYERAFAGYDWNRATYPDSANTASAIATGAKSYNNAIDVDGNGHALANLAELAHSLGKSTGVVSTVQFSDATPAATGGANNISRANRTRSPARCSAPAPSTSSPAPATRIMTTTAPAQTRQVYTGSTRHSGPL